MIYSIYKVTCLVSNKVYIGYTHNFVSRKRRHINLSKINPKTQFHRAIQKHGIDAFVWEVIYQSLDKNHTKNVMEAYFIQEYNSYKCGYNCTLGGDGQSPGHTIMIDSNNAPKIVDIHSTESKTMRGINKGKVVARDIDGKCSIMLKTDYDASNNYVGVNKGKLTAKTKTGEFVHVLKTDPRLLTGELVGMQKGKLSVKDINGKTCQVSVNDPRLITGELVAVSKGITSVKDINGKTYKVPVNDPRILSGELTSTTTGTVICENIHTGDRLVLSINDPRYISGEYQHINKLYITAVDINGNKFRIKKTDPRYISGELVTKSKTHIILVNGKPTRVRLTKSLDTQAMG